MITADIFKFYLPSLTDCYSHQSFQKKRGGEGLLGLNVNYWMVFFILSWPNRVCTLLQEQISRTFRGPFQDSDWFFKDFKFHLFIHFIPKILKSILLWSCTCISWSVNSENFTAWVRQISRIFQVAVKRKNGLFGPDLNLLIQNLW